MADLYRTSSGHEDVRRWCEDQLDRWGTPHERQVIGTAAGDTHLLIAGSGDVSVLYLPGTNFNAATGLTLTAALAATYRVVVADVPGQPGLSAGTRPTGDRPAAYGAWADQVVAQLGADRLVLLGHSLGAAIALAADPAPVHGLLLLDPAGLIRLRVGPAVLSATLPWLVRPTPARSERLLRYLHAAGHPASTAHIEWMTLVARHTRTTGAPSPLPPTAVRRWRGTPRAVLRRAGLLPAGADPAGRGQRSTGRRPAGVSWRRAPHPRRAAEPHRGGRRGPRRADGRPRVSAESSA